MAMQEDNDTTGDVISINGEASDTPEVLDRGDVVEMQPEPKPAIEDAAEPVETAAKDDVRPQHIPKSRFDEVNNQKNELREELAEAKRLIESLRTPQPATQPVVQQAAPAIDMDAKEAAYIEAMMEGDTQLASSIRREINENLIEQAEQRFETRSAQRQAASTLMTASAQAVADFPYLDTDEGAEALELIIASRDAKVSRGMAPVDALRSAVASIAPRFAPTTDQPPVGFDPAKTATDTRTTAALARGATDSTLQPPSVQVGTGNRATAGRTNVSEMSEEQFENLSPAEKKRMRGDL